MKPSGTKRLTEFTYKTIATLRGPYKQKFAIPRQPNLVPEAMGELVFEKEFADANGLRALDQFSHLWLIWHFHETSAQGWSPLVHPPRLGGKEKVGVFASRSPFRPNSIGLSVVRNLGSAEVDGKLALRVGGIDIVDETPILDIKPYVTYADSIADAESGFANEQPGSQRTISFSASAMQDLTASAAEYPRLRDFIVAVLQQDPRPAWRVQANDDKQYGMTLYDFNIKWQFSGDKIEVKAITSSDDDDDPEF
jgi:tRNA-Thr(GGU) m(6)t(6)A37 methyltransferase TsaA